MIQVLEFNLRIVAILCSANLLKPFDASPTVPDELPLEAELVAVVRHEECGLEVEVRLHLRANQVACVLCQGLQQVQALEALQDLLGFG